MTTLSTTSLLLTLALSASASAPDPLQKVRLLTSQGNDVKAIPLLEQLIKDKPDLAEAHWLLAQSLARTEKLAGAEAEAQAALKLEPKRYDALLLMGMLRDLQSDPKGALGWYGKAIELDPKRVEGHREAGASALLSGDVAQATLQLGQAHELAPKDADITRDLVDALIQAKKCPDAQKLAEEAKQRVGLGLALLCQGKAKEAVAPLEQATTDAPEDAQAWLYLAQARAKLGLADTAKEAAQKALELKPTDEATVTAAKALGAEPPRARKVVGPVKPK